MTFEEDLNVTRATYEADTTIPKDISCGEAWAILTATGLMMESLGVIPFATTLPADPSVQPVEPVS